MLKSAEENDQLQRSVKKFKRQAQGDLSSLIGIDDEEPPRNWSSFFDKQSYPAEPYTGEGEEDNTMEEFLERYDNMTAVETVERRTGRAFVDFSLDDCK